MTDSTPSLARALRWCVDNDGECLGDHPKRVALYRELLAAHDPCETGVGEGDVYAKYCYLRDKFIEQILAEAGYSYSQIEHWSNEQNRQKADNAIAFILNQPNPQPAAGSGEAVADRMICEDGHEWKAEGAIGYVHAAELERLKNGDAWCHMYRRSRGIKLVPMFAAPRAGGVPDKCWREAEEQILREYDIDYSTLTADGHSREGRDFDEKLFDMCRKDDWTGIYSNINEKIESRAHEIAAARGKK